MQQRQRAYERSIREAKKRLKVAEDIGDEEAISRYRTLVRARQNRLREFIKEANAGKHNILVRDYSREKIFPRKAIFEAEIERRTWVKDTASKINKFRVDTKVVNSQKFYKNVEDLKLSKKATEALYVKSLEFLNHRNGNVYEDLAAIDMRTGKIIEERTDMDEPFRVSFKGETKSNPRIFNEHVVLVHTHSGSSRPSVSDMGALHRRKAYASVVIGHDGSVRMIKNSKGLAGVEEKYEKLYNRYRKKKNLPKNLAETYAIDDVYRKVGYYGTRIKK